jgi:hypothetical protein
LESKRKEPADGWDTHAPALVATLPLIQSMPVASASILYDLLNREGKDLGPLPWWVCVVHRMPERMSVTLQLHSGVALKIVMKENPPRRQKFR